MDTTAGNHLSWRCATKKFDPSRNIPEEDFENLLRALRMAPSCYGLQPWKFIVVDDPALRMRLKPKAWNQPQVTDASRLVVLCALRSMDRAYIKRYAGKFAEARGIPVERVAGLESFMARFVERMRPAEVSEWMKRQVYLALGVLLNEAAMRRIDACPMEGFEPGGVDEVLGLESRDLQATVLCALGYRSADDPYAKQPKVRFAPSEVILTAKAAAAAAESGLVEFSPYPR